LDSLLCYDRFIKLTGEEKAILTAGTVEHAEEEDEFLSLILRFYGEWRR